MGEKNKMTDVFYFTDEQQISQALTRVDISDFQNRSTLVKLHMGEPRNQYHIRPSFTQLVIAELFQLNASPFLYDTTVVYESPRKYVDGYENVAMQHGFTQENIGCPVVIDEQGVSHILDGFSFEVGLRLQKATHIIALSHVKGHVATGMGGTIKNFGMGGVTRKSKKMMHQSAKPLYSEDACTYCGVCKEVCPFHAIKIRDDAWTITNSCFGCGVCVDNCPQEALKLRTADLSYLLALATLACIKGKKVVYINDVNRIARSCDCDPHAGPILCPDIGYLVSADPVAIDTAALDLINEQKPDVFLRENHVDPTKQLSYAEKLGIGSQKYTLVHL